MQKEMEQNLTKSLEFCDRAAGCGLLFFPEIQLSPFFPQYEGRDVGQYCLTEDSAAVQAPQFYEQDYYTPSDDGFKVFGTPFGKIGIVICYDRHLLESIRTCVLKGADLVIIPTANIKAENMKLFEWEIRVQAMQNQVFVAMCNRVGIEDAMEFSDEFLVVHPSDEVLLKADDREQLLTCELDLSEAREWRSRIPYL